MRGCQPFRRVPGLRAQVQRLLPKQRRNLRPRLRGLHHLHRGWRQEYRLSPMELPAASLERRPAPLAQQPAVPLTQALPTLEFRGRMNRLWAQMPVAHRLRESAQESQPL